MIYKPLLIKGSARNTYIMVSKNELEELAQQARERRKEGSHMNIGNPFPLSGYCFDNAFVLYILLEEKGYNPKMVEGTTGRYAEDLIADGIDLNKLNSTEELAGLVHYWVEVDGYVIDISNESEIEGERGEPLVTKSLPTDYYRFDDSYSEGKKTVDSARQRRCNYCGGALHDCGCPKN